MRHTSASAVVSSVIGLCVCLSRDGGIQRSDYHPYGVSIRNEKSAS